MAHAVQVNGTRQVFDVDGDTPLLWALRDLAGLTGTKYGCGIGLCGACTVLVDGVAERACALPVDALAGRAVTTIEAIGDTPVGQAVQQAWLAQDVVQCGYCQSGQIMAATSLLLANPRPDDATIRQTLSANLCRCGTYSRIHQAVLQAARVIPLRQVG